MKCHHEKECYNYPEKCEECDQLSDIRNHYPRLQTKDLVWVVRCKDCAYSRYVDAADIYRCDRWGYCSEEVKADDYCSRGEGGEG